jgi:cytochrome c oxidase subunit 2
MDLVPGTATYLWLTPTRIGEYEILCEELCGMAHHTMRGRVIVDTAEDFAGWLASQPTYAQILAMQSADPVAGQLAYAPCAACHGPNGEGNVALNAPKLAGLDGGYLRRQLQNYKTGIRGSAPEDVFGAQMRGMAATLVDAAAVNNVVAYINTFMDTPAAPTISGDVQRGAKLYETCINCHGSDGQGIWAMQAPRIAGMSDWYTARQLRDFRDGVRGAHRQDYSGRQMAQFSQMLNHDQEIEDTVAYLNDLSNARLANSTDAKNLR